ncbi:hypothetical protein JI739_24245 [Ramlibacter sp. AW1]|uniref:Uncharacterized protein n=1 Tax=Ramlibacter aurantiacus TaxID=2801330 RepID=A0A936ZM91_9BURK|nr:hypothetical protein [Ramlibacter aurantiacus]MBL0423462.1 hypothetical protein [Ramlibacter aurantiacus]
MIIPAHLNFFQITACGLHKRDSEDSFGIDAAETFQLIYDWVAGKPLEDTIPWDPATGRSGTPKCYCHDVYKCDDSGEYLFVLWKSEGQGGGSILGAQATAPTGNSQVIEYTENYRGKKVIWGHPAYYWIVPALNTVISVKFENSVCDSTMLQDWVSKCITNRVTHPNKVRTETDAGFVRFAFTTPDKNPLVKYSYRFDVHLRSLSTEAAEMTDLAHRITHVVRRETIRLQGGTDDRAGWVKMFDQVPYLPTKPKAKTRQVEVRAEAKPSTKEIKEIIEKFARESRKRSDWDNVGFETDSGTVWVDRYRLHETVHVNKSSSATVMSASDMHAQLAKNRDRLLKSIQKDEALLKKREKAAKAA